MSELSPKYVRDSETEQVQILMPAHINGFDRLFGGQLVEWIDILAAVVARRHSNRNVTTVSIDNLHFKAAAHTNDTVVLKGKITYVGRTSMDVCVETYVEELSGIKTLVNRAYLVLVALDENEQPVPVPGIILETETEKKEWEAGKKRHELQKQRKLEEF